MTEICLTIVEASTTSSEVAAFNTEALAIINEAAITGCEVGVAKAVFSLKPKTTKTNALAYHFLRC